MKKEFQTPEYNRKVLITGKIVEVNTPYSLPEFIEKQDWEEDLELIQNLLNDKLSRSESSYIRRKLEDLSHLRDNRSAEEYALDLVTGWIIEDLFLDILSKNYDVRKDGADRNREFLKKPRADSDLEINVEGREIPLEVTHDNTGFWKRKQVWSTLRDSKFENLKEEGALFLGLDMRNQKVFLIWADEADKIGRGYNSKIGKKASEISLESVEFYDIEKLEETVEEKLERMQ